MAKSCGCGGSALTPAAVVIAAVSPCGFTVSLPSVRSRRIFTALLRAPAAVSVSLPKTSPDWMLVRGPWSPRFWMAVSSSAVLEVRL